MNTRLVIASLLVLPLVACGDGSGSKQAKSKQEASAPVVRSLSSADVIKAEIKPLAESIAFTGTLNPLHSSSLAAEVDATVKEVRVREGEAVSRGQVLAVLDTEALGQSVEEQNAQLDNARSRLALAKVKLDKQRELLQKGFISNIAFSELESDFKIKEGELRAQVSQVVRARRLLQDAQVRAPIAGVVFERKINPGEVASRNQKLFSIADLSELEISATVPARLVSQIHPGMKAHFTVDGLAAVQQGEVVRVNPVAMAGTRSFTIYIRASNPKNLLRAGQFAKGGVVTRQVDKHVVLPQSSVHDVAGKPWVLVVNKGRLQKRVVTVQLVSEADRKMAVDGVNPGEYVVMVELAGSKAGDPVTLPPVKN